MAHPGLPWQWVVMIEAALFVLCLWWACSPLPERKPRFVHRLPATPVIGPALHRLSTSEWSLRVLRAIMVAVFVLIVAAGLLGTPIPGRNAATVLTWTLWWTGVVVSVLFVSSAWCAVCPWDTLSTWLTRLPEWFGGQRIGLGLRVPKRLRNVWLALGLFIVLTWLELGFGVTASPYATALLGLAMVVLATASLALFERKAFCHYFCPVGRTLGFYARLSPVALRPLDPQVCARCETLECYHGTAQVDSCPSHLVMGRLLESTYCTACGNCVSSCPHANVAWQIRAPGVEAATQARARRDEGFFMLGLLALAAFHGITMMPFWESMLSSVGRAIGDSWRHWGSFSLAFAAALILPVAAFALASYLVYRRGGRGEPFWRWAAQLALVALPLAFAYHLAHNLTHLVREGGAVASVWTIVSAPGAVEEAVPASHALIPPALLYSLQAGLMVAGFWIALTVLRARILRLGAGVQALGGWPVVVFAIGVTEVELWMLMQPMLMRL